MEWKEEVTMNTSRKYKKVKVSKETLAALAIWQGYFQAFGIMHALLAGHWLLEEMHNAEMRVANCLQGDMCRAE